MAVLESKTAILGAMKLRSETVNIDGGEVLVTEITAAQYMEIYNSPTLTDDKGEFDGGKFAALLTTHCIVDRKGKRIFSDEDADSLRNGSSSAYTKLVATVKRLNGLGVDAGKN